MTAQERRSMGLLINLKKVGLGFGLAGAFLFLRVWWPIQAERNLKVLKRVEVQVSEKKAELNALNEQFAELTTLSVLDRWAKNHGPWVPARADNVITIQ